MLDKVMLSVYGRPWLINPDLAIPMLSHWEAVRAKGNFDYRKSIKDDGGDTEERETDYAVTQRLFYGNSEVVFAPNDSYALARDFKGFDGARVAVIPVEGPLMKSDFCGDLGTGSMGRLVQMADATESVETIVLLIDSPGGTVAGTEAFAAIVKNAVKRTVALVDGYMCSAAYWIGCSANEVYAATRSSSIGSIGTMASWYDNSKRLEDSGLVVREYYATASKDKNAAFNEATKGEGKRFIVEQLDPLNDVFMSWVKECRSALNEAETLSGKVFTAEKAQLYGLIDGIRSFSELVSGNHTTTKSTQSMKVFQLALAAANAESFEVVDGGFRLTEAQLSSIDTEIQRQATLNAKLSADLAASSKEALTEANGKLSTAEARVKALESELAEAKKNATAASFVGKAADKDAGAKTNEPDASDSYAHNKAIDEMLG